MTESTTEAQRQPVTEFNVGRWCLSEDECIAQGINFPAYERGVRDAANAFGLNRRSGVPADRLHAAIMTNAARDVLAERARQISAKGWTPEHDDEHVNGEMAMAAACYAAHSSVWTAIEHTTVKNKPGLVQRLISAQEFVYRMWPWGKAWWKPKDDRRNLVRAAALILAEIERLDRAAHSSRLSAEQAQESKGEEA
jgi:hypothetical protein